VQATVEVRDQRVRLWLKDFFFDLPNGWVLKDGDKPFLRVSQNPGGWGFLIQAYPNGQAPPATATPVNQLFGLNPGLALSSEAVQPEPQSNRLGMLLMHPPGFATFSKLLSDVAQGSWGTQTEIGPWFLRLLQQRSSMAQINPSMLRKAVMGQARSIENILLQGQEAADDPKTLLKTLLSLLSEEGNNKGVLRQVEDASTEFEAAQAQSAQKMQQGELSLHVILPFIDAAGYVFGCTGRALDKDEKLRYSTIIFDETKQKIFGMDSIDRSKSRVYIVEGPIDSLFLDNCVAMAGSDVQLEHVSSKDKLVVVYDNEPRNSEIHTRISKCIDRGEKVVIWPNNIYEKDINDMILSGHNVNEIIESNTYVGLEATLKFTTWKKI
jgi:hypothetical protein